eukprot:GHVN01076597.1.p1 GENE.GHVN01076597.1~~GHVN01076597.1.p1  ORF type:complete len:471 (-),score=70.17 GHVN01076597.1:973-2385(-)
MAANDESVDQDELEMMGMMDLPVSFGKSTSVRKPARQTPVRCQEHSPSIAQVGVRAAKRSPDKRTRQLIASDDENEDTTGSTGGENDELHGQPPILLEGEKSRLPTKKEAVIPAHQKRISALAANPKCSRVVTGGFDYKVRLWDFNGMTSTMKSFRDIDPADAHPIECLSFMCSGSHFLCCTGEPIMRVYNGEGIKVQETVKGDMYVRDTNHTKGHTHAILSCEGHPFDREKWITSSQDATVRIWDLTEKPYGIDQAIPHLHCLKAVDKRNLNISSCFVLAAAWGPTTANCIVGGCSDGSLQLWNQKRQYGKPDAIVRQAHKINEDTSESGVCGVKVLRDDKTVISRGMDATMKVWDLRKFKQPVHVWASLPISDPKTNIALSPNQDMVLTGTQTEAGGTVEVFNLPSYSRETTLKLPTGAVKVEWGEEINQVMIGSTDGTMRMKYDPAISQRGERGEAIEVGEAHAGWA